MKTVNLKRQVDLAEVNDNKSVHLQIVAQGTECADLANELGILGVEEFSADLNISVKGGDLYRLKGRIRARVVQACSVTLAPVGESIDEIFDELLTTNAETLVPEDEFEGNSDTPVDVIRGDRIDTGEILTQWLALSLDPYPRSDAPVFEYIEDADSVEGKKTYSPFGVLAGLKNTDK